MKLTKAQLNAIREGVATYSPIRRWVSGNGRLIEDPRVIRALIRKGLAFRTPNNDPDQAYLTRAAFALVGAPLPLSCERGGHPCDPTKAWP